MAAADAQDRLRKAGYVASPLAGLPVSVKDLFDVAGERTLAGRRRSTTRHRRSYRRRSRVCALRRGAIGRTT